MTQEQRKAAFKHLGNYLQNPDEHLKTLISNAHYSNAWFTPEETRKAINGISHMLNAEDLDTWMDDVKNQQGNFTPKKIGLVLAGNIPMVGFHDILSVMASGHIALIKSSSQDKDLIPHLVNKLIEFEPEFKNQINFIERLEGFDAVIATGSNNTSRYFEYYFGKVPHIIRKNRNSIAVLTGEETRDELHLLGHDVFDFFGMGCRNISKVFVPNDYDFTTFFESVETYKNIVNHNKYCNNYEYNKSIYLINREKHFDNGFLLVKKDERLASPLAVLYYEEYDKLESAEALILLHSEQIQCIVSKSKLNVSNQQVGFGESQKPKLWDYADGVNTIEFLLSL
ncbi:acyl-CoA reductase [Pedobacter sp. P351]|uniref:acyl-CoA reductase n=1 Tax=Pedobacter superstes TaxID=3133441 RepID=UPI0030B5C4BB